MSEAWVVDASPLILFSRIDRLDLIERLAPSILIPVAVIDEVRDGANKDSTAATALQWAAAYEIPNTEVRPSVEHWDLGSGESQVIAHGLMGSRWVVLDDLSARRCASAHGLPVIGSLGIVLRSKKHGLIGEARSTIGKLIEAGMFLEQGFLENVLRMIGE